VFPFVFFTNIKIFYMKNIYFTVLLCLWASVGYSQNINKIEYFIDADPGYAAGTDVPITAATTVTTNFNVSLASVANGFHTLSIRGRDVNNAWSMVGIRPFYKETLSSGSTPPNITQMEYFIDTDPGYGSGTAVTITAGSPVTTTFIASLTSVSDGFHTLSIRAKDVNNRWSVVGVRPFYKETLSSGSAVPNITQMEYFIDTDPGYGSGTAVIITAGSPLTTTFTASLALVSDGFHTLSIRAKDVNNRWSVVGVRPFYKETLSSGSAVPNITQMEYFIDADPGYGLATALAVTAGSPITQNVNISLGSLTNSVHKLSIRAKDVNNKWSVVGIKDFTVQDNIVVIGGIPANWCKNTTLNIPFTASGTYTSGNIYTAQLSDALGSFTTPTVIGTLTSTAASGTIVATIPNTVPISNGYKVRIISSSPVITNSPIKPLDVVAICQCLNNISLMTGNWSTAGIWSCGHIPLATEPVQISTGHTITLDVNGAAKSLDLRGILNKQATKILTIQGN
jgi:hypothetical protein